MSETFGVSLRVSGFAKESIVDGVGLRYTIFAQGCPHSCLNCHNPQTHSFSGGNLALIEEIAKEVKSNPLLDGVTFSGGEPFEQPLAFSALAKLVKPLTIWCYTGYLFEDLLKDSEKFELLKTVDILVDGRYEDKLRTIEKRFVGSSNQRIIDVKSSLNGECVKLWQI